jgi:hypothetical protein
MGEGSQMSDTRVLILAAAAVLITLILALALTPHHSSPPPSCGVQGVRETRVIEGYLWVICENGRSYQP